MFVPRPIPDAQGTLPQQWMYAPVATAAADPVSLALKRPWQVTVFAWMQFIALPALIISEVVWLVFLFNSGILDLQSGSQTYSDGTTTTTLTTDIGFDPDILVFISIGIMVLGVIEFCIAVGYLRGNRGAHTYYKVWFYLSVIIVPLLIAVLVLVILATGGVSTSTGY